MFASSRGSNAPSGAFMASSVTLRPPSGRSKPSPSARKSDSGRATKGALSLSRRVQIFGSNVCVCPTGVPRINAATKKAMAGSKPVLMVVPFSLVPLRTRIAVLRQAEDKQSPAGGDRHILLAVDSERHRIGVNLAAELQ